MSPIALKRGQAVRVLWVDSASEVGWRYNAEPGGLNNIVSIGYVVNCTPEFLAISTSMDNSNGVIDPLGIPWGAIKNVTPMEEFHLVEH